MAGPSSIEGIYQALLEISPGGIVAIDVSGVMTVVNARFAAMLCAKAESELVGRRIDEIFLDEGARQALCRERLELATAPESHELSVAAANGAQLRVSVTVRALRDGEGRYAGAIAVITDLTEQKKLEARIMASERMASVGMLAGGVAHEINNPLTAVLANLDLATRAVTEVSEKVPDRSLVGDLPDEIREAREAADRVRQIVRDLRLFSSAQDDEAGPCDVRRVLDSSARMAWNEIKHRAHLMKDYQGTPVVAANKARLGQLFLNLIINATQAIPEGSADDNCIRLVTNVAPGQVLVEIADTGTGMTAAVREKLFTPFFTTKPQGAGLGLAICHQIVSELKGRIEIETHPGKGSCFRVMLPSELATAAPKLKKGRRGAPRRSRILIVDDERMVAQSVRRVLEPEHDVTTVARAGEALRDIVLGRRWDLILCDLMMPQMTGMDLFQELSRIAPDQASKMIFLTGGVFTPRARDFLDRVANVRIEKPFDTQHLLTLVNERCGAK